MTITDHDADRLDTWLEGETGFPLPTSSPNGHGPVQRDLVGVAQQVHAEMQAAEQQLPVPTRAIWEDVMASTAHVRLQAPAATNGGSRVPPAGRPPVAMPEHRGFLYWAIPIGLMAIVVLGLLAVTNLASRPQGPNETPGLSVSALTASNASVVVASPAVEEEGTIPFSMLDPTSIDCSEVTRRSNEEVAALQADPGEFPPREYGPAVPADPENARLVSTTDQYTTACRAEWRTMASPRLIYETRQTGNPGALFPGLYLEQGYTLDDLPGLLQSLLTAVNIDEVQDLIVITDAFGDELSWAPVINPNHVHLFPDGRMGAPQSWVFSTADVGSQTALRTQFVFYVQDPTQDGKWVLDETLPVCVGECDEFWDMVVDPATWGPVIPESATPVADDPDMERWLTHPDDIDCVRADPDPLEGVPGVTRSSMLLSDYLPFADASPEDQVAIAETMQERLANCDPGDQPIIAENASFFGPSLDAAATQEQFDTAQALSQAVETDDLMDFIAIVDERPTVVYAGDQLSFSRRTLLPESVVALPDGRFGGPMTIIMSSFNEEREEIEAYLAERGQIETTFIIFTQQDDAWVLDESIMICLGDCDDWWASYQVIEAPALSATPVASDADIAQWLVPSYSVDCGTPVANDVNSNEWPTDLVIDPDSYLPFGEAAPDQQEVIAETALRAFSGCATSTMRSDDFAWMPGPSVAIPTDDQIAAARTISAALPDQDPESYYLVVPSANTPAGQGNAVILPADVVQLPDGRLGALARIVFSSDEDAQHMRAETIQLTNGSLFFMTVFFTFQQEGDRWLLDEMFLVCIGECDEAWDMMADGTIPGATPTASPVSAADFPPITAEECTVTGLTADEVSAIISNPGEEPERSYVPVGPANATDAVLATQADRAWQSCRVYGSMGQQAALQTPWLTAHGPEYAEYGPAEPVAVVAERQSERNALSQAMLTGDALDYVVATDQSEAETMASMTPWQEVPDPSRATLLQDGRIALPMITLAPYDLWAFSDDAQSMTQPYVVVVTHILAPDLETGRWLVDEVILLCGGDCDQWLTGMAEWEAAALEQSGVVPATLVATPASGDD